MLVLTALPQASALVWEIRYERPFLSCLIFWEGSLIRKRNLSGIYSFESALHGEQKQSNQRLVFFLGFEFGFGFFWFRVFCYFVCVFGFYCCYCFGFVLGFFIVCISNSAVIVLLQVLRGGRHTR